MIRTITRTAAVTAALGAGAMSLAAPTAQADPTTYSSSTQQATPAATATTKVRTLTLHYGMRGAAVKDLQAALTSAGFEVPQTGWFGPMTRAAVREYQASQGLHVTGVATAPTLRALGLATTTVSAKALTSTTYSAGNATTAPVTSVSSQAQAAVAFAYAQIGKPYVYGATGPSAYDCSGLTQAAWASAGVSIPRTSYAQWSGLQSVSTSNLQPGDIVVFYGGGHVGIYVGNGYVIHAPHPGSSVEKVLMSSMPVAGAVRPA